MDELSPDCADAALRSHVEGFKNIVVGSFPGRLQELQNLCGNIEVVRYTSYCKCNTT